MSHKLSIPSIFEATTETPCVDYELVGRVVYKDGHYTTDILLPYNGDISTFRYDDMRYPMNKRGQIDRIGDKSTIDGPPRGFTDFYVYRRTSDVSQVTSSISALQKAYSDGKSSWSKFQNPVYLVEEEESGPILSKKHEREISPFPVQMKARKIHSDVGAGEDSDDVEALGDMKDIQALLGSELNVIEESDYDLKDCDSCGKCDNCKWTIKKL